MDGYSSLRRTPKRYSSTSSTPSSSSHHPFTGSASLSNLAYPSSSLHHRPSSSLGGYSTPSPSPTPSISSSGGGGPLSPGIGSGVVGSSQYQVGAGYSAGGIGGSGGGGSSGYSSGVSNTYSPSGTAYSPGGTIVGGSSSGTGPYSSTASSPLISKTPPVTNSSYGGGRPSKGFYPYNPMNHPPPSYTKNSPTNMSSTPTYTTIPIHTNGVSSQR